MALHEERDYVTESLPFKVRVYPLADDRSVLLSPADPDGVSALAIHSVGQMGMPRMEEAVRALAPLLQPKLIISLGISGNLDSSVQLGDLVLATSTDDYMVNSKYVDVEDRVKVSWAGETLPTSDRASASFMAKIRLGHDQQPLWGRVAYRRLDDYDPPDLRKLAQIARPPKLHLGPVACGAAVVASREFRELLKSKNRNFLAVDMESAGVARASRAIRSPAELMILRAISDHADPAKSALEASSKGAFRRWAMQSAAKVLLQGLQLDSGPPAATFLSAEPTALQKDLDILATEDHLPEPYASLPLAVTTDVMAAADVLFTHFVPGWREPIRGSVTHVINSNVARPLQVSGPAGAGKSTFLAALFWGLRTAITADTLLAFIDLERFASLDGRQEGRRRGEAPTEALHRHLATAFDRLKQADKRLILIVDGHDPNTESALASEAHEALEELLATVPHHRVIGIRTSPATPDKSPSPGTRVIRLSPVQVSDRAAATAVCGSYLALTSITATAPRPTAASMVDRADTLNILELDLFTIALLSEAPVTRRSPLQDDVAALVESYCLAYFERALTQEAQRTDALNRAARLAFELAAEDRVDLRGEHDSLAWALVRRHEQIASYLTARHVLAEFKTIGQLKHSRKRHSPLADAHLQGVYPYGVNRFCKALLQRSQTEQREVMAGIERVLTGRFHPYAKAHAAYLAGRMPDGQVAARARQSLRHLLRERLAEQQAQVGAASHPALLLLRSLYISLAYLGDDSAVSEYIGHLLHKPQWDHLNRGFHLEYYGDRAYSPARPLLSSDDLGPCPRTMRQLHQGLSRTSRGTLWKIELHTLLSLAQHRHAIGHLDNESRELALEAIHVLRQRAPLPQGDEFRAYVEMVHRHLSAPSFSPMSLVWEAHSLKHQSRRGWVKRRFPEPVESVADHTFGAWLLALLLLPERHPARELAAQYDKQRILRMLLVHDLAEARFGDYLPEENTTHKRDEERSFFEELWPLGTYEGIAPMNDLYMLWDEFQAGASLNSKVARDIDRLDNLVELYRYAQRGSRATDFDPWKEAIKDSMRSDLGPSLAERLIVFLDQEVPRND